MRDHQALVDATVKVLKTAPQVYEDLAQPSTKQTGKFLERIPRAINAALAPLDIWIAKQEFNLAETKKLLEAELKNIDPGKIVPPEPYVAVPAIQAISYCMDSDELRSMYAKLLAKAINIDWKDFVHPSFVEIIKQMAPLDAHNLSYFNELETPVGQYLFCPEDYNKENSNNTKADTSHFVIKDSVSCYFIILTNIFLLNPFELDLKIQSTSLSSLQRLGLISVEYGAESTEGTYEQFDKTEEFIELCAQYSSKGTVKIQKGVALITPLGESFINVCIK